ncbi:MAG TPA: 2-dehydro-3-deoxyphosphooctonate aldolase [Bacteroidales bacterium]|jgi:hypothetical protein|nr:2-dehydro-3-deoxyphosphooctonate aldolase [Bacteroidales bacterium]
MRKIIILFAALLLISCGSTKNRSTTQSMFSGKHELVDYQTFKVDEYSQDESYGYTEKNPIKVGGVTEGPMNERRFLNALAGPNGEKISYYRMGSCCHFKTQNSPTGTGLLDKYSVTYKGATKEIVLYINMYDVDLLKVPVGFTLKK